MTLLEAAEVTVETYIERIPRDDQAAEEELEAFATEGLNSGEPVEDDERYWAEKRQRLIDRDLDEYADYLAEEAMRRLARWLFRHTAEHGIALTHQISGT